MRRRTFFRQVEDDVGVLDRSVYVVSQCPELVLHLITSEFKDQDPPNRVHINSVIVRVCQILRPPLGWSKRLKAYGIA